VKKYIWSSPSRDVFAGFGECHEMAVNIGWNRCSGGKNRFFEKACQAYRGLQHHLVLWRNGLETKMNKDSKCELERDWRGETAELAGRNAGVTWEANPANFAGMVRFCTALYRFVPLKFA
jgi:hypothetical protein